MTLALNETGTDKSAVHLFEPESCTLANGMEVVVITNRRAPVVSHWCWYKVGTADSPAGKSGLPHFVEHLMFKGTRKVPPGEFSKIVARHGGEDNAFTSLDFTAYFQTIARDRLPMVMEMEADRMVNLALLDEHVYPERDVIVEERRSRVDNDPGSLLSEHLSAAQFLHHPYRLPVIGWMHEIQSYTRADVEDFYAHWYAPNNAILIVSGDIDMAELLPLAEATYGKLSPRDVPARKRLVEPPQLAARRLELKDSRVRQPSLIRSYLAPSLNTPDPVTGIGGGASKARSYALEILAEALGGGATSRLYQSLVVERGLATGAGTYYRGTALDETTFRVVAAPRPEIPIDTLEDALDEVLAQTLEMGVTAGEVARIQKRLVAEATFARDSLGTAARVFGVALTTGGCIEDVETWPDEIAKVTPEEVNLMAREMLRIERSVTGRLLPDVAISERAAA
ncbi:zinc protease [Arboricoccus pini]|uniref:Zinc protease n=1 Tax=Arboricoccus pini TaxID=1963835 RepID=A0A212Q3R9_9PROT|nr:pitrilysin family protein [Arboricoccus pini]SNB53973.1 zinc protease [Arboricoccus pini]